MAERLIAGLTDPAVAKQVGANGQDLIDQHFTLQRVLERHLEVLGTMVAARGR
ncbi:hypothetical protein ACFQY4_12490 [Catellatospora bangladeshensis]